MKYLVIYLLLALSGLFLLVYTINRSDFLNWQKLDQVLAEKKIITQAETRDLVIDYYRQGILADYLEQRNVLQLALAILFTTAGIVGFVHLAVDKLFYRKFYEEPRIWPAFRRSVIWGILPTGIFYLAIYNLFQISLFLFFILILVCVELLLSNFNPFNRKSPKQKPDNPAK